MATTKKTTGYWGRRAPLYLLRDWNCAHASLEAFQDMIGRPENSLLKAATGLEGGVVASGSTCGVLTGGALGLALLHKDAIEKNGETAKQAVLLQVRDYLRWFENRFGATACRQRTGVNFYTLPGQVRYLLPGDRVGRCMWHIRGAIRHLHTCQAAGLPETDEPAHPSGTPTPVHCAQVVLKGIRERTGVGDPMLEMLSFVFDGGVGLHGGVCGALAGAIMGLNCHLGVNIRQTNFFRTFRGFAIGHINLLLKKHTIGKPEPFAAGKKVLEHWRRHTSPMECRAITNRAFAEWNDFQSYINSSDTCARLMERAISDTSDVIEGLKGTSSDKQ